MQQILEAAQETLLGAVASNGPELKFNIDGNGANAGVHFAGQQVYTFGSGWNEQLTSFLIGGASILFAVALVLAVVYFVVGSVIEIGYYRFNLDLVDRKKEPEINTLVGYFAHWKTTAAAKFLQGLYVFLWSLLFVIPGIIAGYSYAMLSKQMMYGNRFRLFCLQLSFIGWDLLCSLTMGIGNLWLKPYKQAATAAFYRNVSGTEHIVTPTN